MRKYAAVLLILLLAGWGYGQESGEEEIPVTAGETLRVNLDTGGSLAITGTGESRAVVRYTVSGPDAGDVKVSVLRRKGEVEINSVFREDRRHRRVRLELEIRIPRRFELKLHSMGGGITLKGIEGEIRGTTMGGSLKLSDLKGRLELKTMGGEITLRDSAVDGRVLTMGGRVLLENVSGDLDAKSMGGQVVYRNVRRDTETQNGEAIRITSMGGPIHLNQAPHGARVKTMGGDISIRRAEQFLQATTMGGDISVDAVDGWIEAVTMGGDIEVTMTGDPYRGKRDVQLVSKGGDITLTLPAELSMKLELELAYTRGQEDRYQIRSDFPLELEKSDQWDRSQGSPRRYIYGKGKNGDGKHRVVIKTINGTITLIKTR